jgi:site-specific DNA-cytosine methylase
MKILVACEESQTVLRHLLKRGHDAYSCDIIDCSGEFPDRHIKDDVLKHLAGWDMIIGFPPCTDLAVSGARYFKEKIADGRQQLAVDFFMAIANADCEKIAIENPVGIMSTKWRKPDTIIQPWMFGEDASKKTCLWLKNLPALIPTKLIIKDRYSNQTPSGQNKLAPSPERAKLRSKTYEGIARAMAEQWT